MFTIQRLFVFLGVIFLVGCASTGDLTRTQIFDDGTLIEFSATGDPVRFTDTSGNGILSALSR